MGQQRNEQEEQERISAVIVVNLYNLF